MQNQKDGSIDNNAIGKSGTGQGSSTQMASGTGSDMKDVKAVNVPTPVRPGLDIKDVRASDAPTPVRNADTAVDKAKETAGSLLDQAKSTAKDAYESATEKAGTTVKEYKAGLTDSLSGVADTVRRVSGTISQGETQNPVTNYAAQYSETAAKKLEDVAHYFERSDLRVMARDAETYARRNPAIFLGGAFVLGVLAARFIKSTPPPQLAAGASVEPRPLNVNRQENRSMESAAGAI